MEDLNKRIRARETTAHDLLTAPISSNGSSYDQYRKYDYQNRTTFQKNQLPPEIVKTVKFGSSGAYTNCYLHSVTEINEDFYEIALKIEDAESFNVWERYKDKTTSLEKSLKDSMGVQLPEGIGIKYVRFMRGSLIIIIGIILTSAIAPKVIAGVTFLAALKGLSQIYKFIDSTEWGKKFFSEFDKKVLDWLKGVLIKIEDWLLASSLEFTDVLKTAAKVAGAIGVLAMPIPTLIAVGLVALIRKL